MAAKQFVDTNILVYVFASNDPRSARAESSIAEGGFIGVQILHEFTNVTRCKRRWQWEQIEAAAAVIVALARTMYANARLSAEYRDWKYRDVLERRITDADTSVGVFRGSEQSQDRNSQLLLESDFSCMACHRR